MSFIGVTRMLRDAGCASYKLSLLVRDQCVCDSVFGFRSSLKVDLKNIAHSLKYHYCMELINKIVSTTTVETQAHLLICCVGIECM